MIFQCIQHVYYLILFECRINRMNLFIYLGFFIFIGKHHDCLNLRIFFL